MEKLVFVRTDNEVAVSMEDTVDCFCEQYNINSSDLPDEIYDAVVAMTDIFKSEPVDLETLNDIEQDGGKSLADYMLVLVELFEDTGTPFPHEVAFMSNYSKFLQYVESDN